MERFSILIPFVSTNHRSSNKLVQLYIFKLHSIQLRELIQKMKEQSGLKNIYQNNVHPISPKSLKMFLNMAQVHMCDRDIGENSRSLDNDFEIHDVHLLGLEKFKHILRIESRKNLTSRFTWGSMKESNINLNEATEETEELTESMI